jgi:predicted GIY-YIG superfamily endonuclease
MINLIEQINNLITNVSSVKNQLHYMKRILTLSKENEDVSRETEVELKRIKRFFETSLMGSSIFPFGTQYVYVWELEGGKYYVGWTENLSRRLDEHMNEEGSIWTKKYRPISVVEIVRGDKQVEKMKTLQYMKEKGFENVRGSIWCLINYKIVPMEVQRFLLKGE